MYNLTKLNENPYEYASDMNVKELEKLILDANDAYFNKDAIISDEIYDMLIDFLKLKNKNSKVLKKIGSTIKDPKAKVKLEYKLFSMDKKKEEDKINKWIKEYKSPYILTDKLDGISGSIVYKNDGNIIFNTRGTATHGLNINKLLKYLPNIPSYDKVKKYCDKNNLKGDKNLIAFRGEILISKKNFDKNWKDKKANARNTIGGLVNSKNLNPTLAKDARFVIYELIDPKFNIEKQLKIIKDIGFEPVYHKKLKELDYNKLNKYLKKRRKNSQYDIDGIIVTNNENHKRDNSGNPKYAFAFKVLLEDQKAITEIVDIEWKISKDGYINPTVIIKPVKIGGVTISRVTAFNAKYVKENNLGKGAKIEIVRSGDVIPKIEKIIKKAKKILFPSIEYKWSESGVDILSIGDNSQKDIKEILYFFSKLDVKGMGEKNVEKLYDNGYNSVEKILKANKNDFLKLDGFKEKSATKLEVSIKKSMTEILLEDLMGASNRLGRGVGSRKAKTVLDFYPNIITEYKKWKKDEFISKIKEIPGWDDKSATSFVNNFKNFIKFYNSIKKYIKLKNKTKKIKKNKITGLSFVMSGFRDKDLSLKMEEYGAKIMSSISSNTDYLVVKDNSVLENKTSKILKAEKLNIKIIVKDELLKLING